MSDIAEAREADRTYRMLKPYFLSGAGTLDRGRGAAFPTTGLDGGALVTGERFFRTDLGRACYYDGTRWLTAQEYVLPLATVHHVQTAIATALVGEVTFRQDYAPYFTRHTTEHVVAATNNGANFWSLTYRTMTTAGGVDTTLVTWNTSADTAGVYVMHDGTVVTTTPNYGSVQLIAAGTGAPGALTLLGAVLSFRLIIT